MIRRIPSGVRSIIDGKKINLFPFPPCHPIAHPLTFSSKNLQRTNGDSNSAKLFFICFARSFATISTKYLRQRERSDQDEASENLKTSKKTDATDLLLGSSESSKESKSSSKHGNSKVNLKLKNDVEFMISQDKKELVAHLNQLFGFGTVKAKQAVSAVDSIEFPITTNFLHERFNYLQQKKQLPTESIKKMPWLILLKQAELNQLEKNVSTILELSLRSGLPFTRFPVSKLYDIRRRWKRESRIEPELRDGHLRNRMDYMASVLKCKEDDILDMFGTVTQLASTPFSKLRTVLTLLLEYGVYPEDIIGDPWIFTHKIVTMRTRLEIARKVPISRVKPWLLRTEQKHFDLYMSRCEKELHLRLGHADLESFLQETLHCTKPEVDHIMFKVPAIKPATASKLYDMIQFLFSKGYTTRDIVKTPRILARSRETVERRMMEINSLGPEKIPFSVLCLNTKDYEAHKLKRMYGAQSAQS